MLDSFFQDLRFGARMLVKRPRFTLTILVVLALGIGANTAIFSIVNSVLLRPLPYHDASRLVEVSEIDRSNVFEAECHDGMLVEDEVSTLVRPIGDAPRVNANLARPITRKPCRQHQAVVKIGHEPEPFDERGPTGNIRQRRRRAPGHQIRLNVELVIG